MFFVPLVVVGAIGLAILLRPWPLFPARDEAGAPNMRPSERSVAGEFGKWVQCQALARGLNVRGVARPVPIECPKCRKASNYFVYPDELCERCWRATLKPLSTPVKNGRA
jgi:hypothetical protein